MTLTTHLDRWTKDEAASNLVEIKSKIQRQDKSATSPFIKTSTNAARDGTIVSFPHRHDEWWGLHGFCLGYGVFDQKSNSS
jgi:hypothetical protein